MSHLTAIDIAAEFIRLGIDNKNKLSHMQVQKLVYISNGFSLAVHDEQLFEDTIKAWKFGPVIPTLYDELRGNRNNLIAKTPNSKEISDDFTKRLIKLVYDKYGYMDAWRLSALTHLKDTPWYNTWNATPLGIITPAAIRSYYRSLLSVDAAS